MQYAENDDKKYYLYYEMEHKVALRIKLTQENKFQIFRNNTIQVSNSISSALKKHLIFHWEKF